MFYSIKLCIYLLEKWSFRLITTIIINSGIKPNFKIKEYYNVPTSTYFFESVNRDYILDDDTDLADQITLLAAQINAATYRFLKLVAEFDRRCGWSGAGVRSCAHWLNWKCGRIESNSEERSYFSDEVKFRDERQDSAARMHSNSDQVW